MKYLLIALVLLCSCKAQRLYKQTLIEKGYAQLEDTVLIKPYEYYIHHKGYYGIYRECAAENPLNVKFSIKGYEDVNQLPLSVLKDSIQFVLSDPSIKEIVDGKLLTVFGAGGYFASPKTDDIDAYKFLYIPKKGINPKAFLKSDRFFSFCIKVKKEGVIYTIPSREYKVIIDQ